MKTVFALMNILHVHISTISGGSVAHSTIRLRGYSIRVSNVSNVSPGSTDECFTDDMSHTIPTVVQEECKKATRYIWFYQTHRIDSSSPILEICEVQIFGKFEELELLSSLIASLLNCLVFVFSFNNILGYF